MPRHLDALRTELADLAYDLERQGRRDAADVVMLIDIRVREIAAEFAATRDGEESRPVQEAVTGISSR